MKIKIFACVFILFIVCSCESFLEPLSQEGKSLEEYYSDPVNLEKAVLAAYGSLNPVTYYDDMFNLVGDVCSDDAFAGNKTSGDIFTQLAQWNINGSNPIIENKAVNKYNKREYQNSW